MDIHVQTPETAARVLADVGRAILSSDPHKADELFILARAFEKPDKRLMVEYPFTLEPCESPDFIIRLGDRQIGLEITTLRAPQLAKAESIAAELGIGLRHNHFGFSSPNLRAEEVKTRLQSLPPQAGLSQWICIEQETDCFIKQLTRIIRSKTEKILIKGSSPCSENWLLIEDRMGIGKTQERPICEAICKLHVSQSSYSRFDQIILMLVRENYSFFFGPWSGSC